jgi:murein DD-endopeptidase MepM/ murein hydrolase activator NlpD
MSWIMPFPEKAITGEFGTMSEFRRKNNMQAHSGTDWAPAGSNKGKTSIPAITRGTIRLVQWSNVLGWVLVQTAMDKDRNLWYIGYCHLACNKCGVNCKGGHDASIAITRKVGDKVNAGDSVGIMGNTGSASSGVHLHATLGKQLRDVFGPTSAKSDLKKAILANQGAAPKPKAAAPAPVPAPVAAPRPVAPVPAKPVNQVPAKPVTPAVAKTTFHKVRPGETLARIAAQYSTTVDKLVADNGIRNANLIQVGQMIRIEK